MATVVSENRTRHSDPLLAVPEVAPYVRLRLDGAGCGQIKRQPAPGRGVRGWLARRFGMFRRYRIDLDERGTFFWQQIDGQRNLRMIARLMRNRFGLGEQEAADAVVLFTKALMRRGMIYLDLSYRKERGV